MQTSASEMRKSVALIAFHTGNDGGEKSVLVIDLDREMSAAVMFHADDLEAERIPWARDLLEALRSFPEPVAGSGASVPALLPVGLPILGLLLLATGLGYLWIEKPTLQKRPEI